MEPHQPNPVPINQERLLKLPHQIRRDLADAANAEQRTTALHLEPCYVLEICGHACRSKSQRLTA